MTITTFEDSSLGSAADELDNLGMEFTAALLLHCQRVKTEVGIHRNWQVYATYEGVEMFRALIRNQFAILAVEVIDADDIKVTVMFAGQYGAAVRVGNHYWDGVNDNDLRTGLLQARAEAYFS